MGNRVDVELRASAAESWFVPRGSADSLTLLVVAFCLVGILGLALPAPLFGAQEESWIWAGGVTSSTASVKARIVGASDSRELIVTAIAEAIAEQPPVIGPDPPVGTMVFSSEPDAHDIFHFRLEGLAPGTRYAYRLDDARERLRGSFHTFWERQPASYRVVFGSCASTGSDHDVFEVMASLEPHLMIHMGDLHYENITRNDPRLFLDAFGEVLTSETQSVLYRSTPIAYVWDDHDYGPNDSGKDSSSKAAALEAYGRVVPHYPLAASPPEGGVASIYQAFSVGRVRFILTDVRSEREDENKADNDDKTMLGLQQRAWLVDELERSGSSHSLIVWVNVVPWITKNAEDSEHGWARYSHERRFIADAVRRLGLTNRMLVLSGDAHMVAVDDGRNSLYVSDPKPGEHGFPVFHAAPLDRYAREKGGPYSHGTAADKKFFGLGSIQQFGFMEVEDDGETLTASLTGRDDDGDLIEGMTLRLECRELCAVVPFVDKPTIRPGTER